MSNKHVHVSLFSLTTGNQNSSHGFPPQKKATSSMRFEICNNLFIYLLQFNDNKQHHHKDSLQKSHRPHTKADHLKKKNIYIYVLNKKMNN